jgi:hypothetical protein
MYITDLEMYIYLSNSYKSQLMIGALILGWIQVWVHVQAT